MASLRLRRAFFAFFAHEVQHVAQPRVFVLVFHCTHAFGFPFLGAFQRESVFKRQVRHERGYKHFALVQLFQLNDGGSALGAFGAHPLHVGQRHAGGSLPLAVAIHCNPNQGVQVNFQQAQVPHLRDVAHFNVQLRVFASQDGQKPGLLDPRAPASVRGFQHLFFGAILGHPLHGRVFGLDQPVLHEPGHDAGHRGVLAQAFRNVRFRPEPLVVVGHALVPHAQFLGAFVNHGKRGRHAAHDALGPNHGRIRQVRHVHDFRNFHGRHRNAAKQVNAVAARAVQKVARFGQHRVQALAQHAIRRVVVGLVVLQRLPEIRLHVHVGFRVKLAHHLAHAAAAVQPMFRVHRNPTTLADFAVHAQHLGLGQGGNAVPVFRNAGRVHAVRLLPLLLRVVFYQRRILRGVQHLEQALQRHHEPRHRPHRELHGLDAALGVSQLRRRLPLVVHLVQHVDRRGLLHEGGVH